MPDLLPQLDRIERDPAGLPSKLYPFTRAVDTGSDLARLVADRSSFNGNPVCVA
jgi:hypothetical protein